MALSGNWHDPTEDPGALEPGAGQVQSPEDGDALTGFHGNGKILII